MVAMKWVQYPLSQRNAEDPLFQLRIDVSHDTVCRWSNAFPQTIATSAYWSPNLPVK